MFTGLGWIAFASALLAGVLLDAVLGETRRFHPLVGFGRLAAAIETRLNSPAARSIGSGALAWSLAVLPPTTLAWFACEWSGAPAWQAALHALMLYACVGLRSLRDHMLPIWTTLRSGDLPAAREFTSRIVSRDIQQASASDLATAATESTLENGNDAVFGTLFWFAIAGGPGAVLYRLANTLDAMWGYRNERYNLFGRVAARIDDVLNYVPARLTALSYALLAPGAHGTRRAFSCWRAQAPAWSSPNAGPVMASGAGALGVSLGGEAFYDGQREHRPPLGRGSIATGTDILRAWRLVRATTCLWIAVILLAAAGAAYA